MASVIKVEKFDTDVAADGSTLTLANSVGSLADGFVRKITSTDKATGPVGNTGNANPDDVHCGIELTGVDTLTFRKGSAVNQKQVGEVWRYVGVPGGSDEFIVRGSYAVTITGTSATQAITGLGDRNKAVPIFNGLSTTNGSVNDYDGSTVAVHINSSGQIEVTRNNSTGTLVVYVTVVEFTGSNWTVAHGRSASHDALDETVTMNSDSTGLGGSTVDIGDWTNAMIIEATMGGDTAETGLSDVLARVEPGATDQAIFRCHQDANARNDAVGYFHVIANDNLVVTRATNANFAEGNNSYTTAPFPAGTNTTRLLEDLSLEWFADTSGVGTAHARGRLTAEITNSTGTIQTWVHRSGNNVGISYGVADFTNVEGVIKPKITDLPSPIQTDALNVVVTGENFLATQGLGKVEIWSDQTGTVKSVQTIDSWSNTSIQFDIVPGAIAEGLRYLVVTDNNGLPSSPRAFTFGLPSYLEIIDTYDLDHLWTLDGDYIDTGFIGGRDMNQSVVGTQNFVSAICDGVAQSVQFVGTNSRREVPDNNEMNLQGLTTRTMFGWITLEDIQKALSTVYKEGGSVNNLMFVAGYGNALMAQLADTGDDNAQAYSDFKLKPGRPYLITFRYNYSGDNTFYLLIDGIEQSESDGNPLTATDLDAHSGDNTWGQSDTSLEMGGTDVSFVASDGCKYGVWGTSRTDISTADLRQDFFEKGALPDVVITSDTEANMQIQIDALADTLRRDWSCCIRVEKCTDNNDPVFDADNITFEEGASIHVQWLGGGTLGWKNLNGSDASIGSVLGGGTINFINPAILTLSGLQPNTEVRVFEAGTTNELAGGENETGIFTTSVEVPSVDIFIHALGFLNQKLKAVNTTTSVSLPIQQRVDRQYQNN